MFRPKPRVRWSPFFFGLAFLGLRFGKILQATDTGVFPERWQLLSGSLVAWDVATAEYPGQEGVRQWSLFYPSSHPSYFPTGLLPRLYYRVGPQWGLSFSIGFLSFSDGEPSFFFPCLAGAQFFLAPDQRLFVNLQGGGLWVSTPYLREGALLWLVSVGRQIQLWPTLFWVPEMAFKGRGPLGGADGKTVFGYTLSLFQLSFEWS